jgi:hypothetical protein
LAYDATAGLWKNIDIPESAAVISSATAPANTTAIWFNTENGNTYIYYDDFWTSIAGSTGAPIISDTAPADPVLGTQWFNSSTGKSYLYYSNAWIEIDSNGTATASTGNVIINGAFDIWQRGTSLSSAGAAFLADRFRQDSGTGSTWVASRQNFSPAELNAGSFGDGQYFYRTVVTSGGNAASSYSSIDQTVEDVRTLAGQTVTLSYWAKADSVKSIAFEVFQAFGTGGSTGIQTTIAKQQITTSWSRYSHTFQLPSISGATIGVNSSSRLRIWFEAGSNFAARSNSLGIQSGTFDIWGVQLEAGSVATPFRRNAPSIQAELAACQRYYWRLTPSLVSARLEALVGATATTDTYGTINNPVPMRIPATSVDFSALRVVAAGSGVVTVTSLGLVAIGTVKSTGIGVFTAGGLTPGTWYTVDTSSTAGFIGFSAEL